MRYRGILYVAGLLLLTGIAHAQTTRVRDITRLAGVRSNQLVGYGLVVGLDGSGDSKQTLFTINSITNMLTRFGIQVPSGGVKVKNVAAVMVTADLPAFVRPGDKIDVVVSSLGDARSLQGGTLLQVPLMGADTQVYAVAQGSISIGGFAGGSGGASVTKNHPTVGRVPDGALVEKEVPMTVTESNQICLSLRNPDFTTAAKIAQAIETSTGASAVAEDAGRVKIPVPEKYRNSPVTFVAMIGEVPINVDPSSKIVINERTGTIVIGGAARLSPVAVAHGGLTVTVSKEPIISQPNPLSTSGRTVTDTRDKTKVQEDKASLVMVNAGDTLQDLISALNAIKATPRDVIAILQAIKEAGGLQAELEVL